MFYVRINKIKVFNNREGFRGLFDRTEPAPAVLYDQTAGHDAADKYNIIHDIENNGHFPVSNRPGIRSVTTLNGFSQIDGNRASCDGKLPDGSICRYGN
ncbi:MAG: hypothetical protein LBL07_05155 [Tannerella sp.]|jgi:hypothetical protein|nr:hypothetical protein [Tannerella sp.]